MSKFVEGYLASIPAGQQAALRAILDLQKASGELTSTEEYQQRLKTLLKAIQAGSDFEPSLRPTNVDEEKPTTISSRLLNDVFQAIHVDLCGLYKQLNAADQTLLAHEAVRKADWAKIQDGINRATADLMRHRYIKLNSEWQDVKYFDFWTARVGETSNQAAEIDLDTKVLSLGTISNNRLEQQRGAMRVQAEVYEITPAEAEGSSSTFAPERALDNNQKSFWAHLLLTDQKVTSVWDGTTYDGALVGYTVTFANAEFLNYVCFLPYSSFPVKLIDLQYKDGADWATVPGFSSSDASLDWTEIRFERIQANALRLVFQQANYAHNKYLVPRYAFGNARLWNQIGDEEILMGVDEDDLTAQDQTTIETNPRFRSYLSALKRIEDRLGESGIVQGVLSDHENVGRMIEAVTQVITDNRSDDSLILRNAVQRDTDADAVGDDNLVEVDKYEYMFGLRTLRMHDRNYVPIGAYKSPLFVQRANPYEIAIDATESHVELDAPEGGGATYREASVEYELELSPDRKHNVLPDGTTSVPDELVFINPATKTGTLRFIPNGTVQGRASSRLLTNGVDFSVLGKVVTILQNFNKNKRYTFTYTPLAGQDSLDVDSTYDSVELSSPEVFNSTDAQAMIDLKSYPYVAYDIVNSDGDWQRSKDEARWSYRMAAGDVTIDGISYGPTSGLRTYEPLSVHVNGTKARNITNYRSRVHPGFYDDPEYPTILQYIHVGKRLYFNRPLTGVTIEVLYRWMVQYVRLNITLRGHNAVVNSYTPVISDYTIKVKSGR